LKNSHILDQYGNPSNPLAHYDGTAEEILAATEGKLDAIVIAAGTGGTIAGIARKLKERVPNCKVIGVDPTGSILVLPETLNGAITSYKVEGIGYDFVPKVLDRQYVDSWIKTEDKESLIMARRLIREEGLLCGGSAGAAMVGALKVCKELKAGQRCVVLLADSVRNYMTKFLNDQWMVDNGFLEETAVAPTTWWSGRKVSELKLAAAVSVAPSVTCSEAAAIMRNQNFDQLPVIGDNGDVLGVVTMGNLTSQLVSGRVTAKDPVSRALFGQFKKVAMDTTLASLSKIFDRDHFALVVASQLTHSGGGVVSNRSVVVGVVTRYVAYFIIPCYGMT
jgi:cystathionine beta-synthase